MSISSLRDITGTVLLKSNLNSQVQGEVNDTLFQMWEAIKYSGNLMPAKIKGDMVTIENEILKQFQYKPNSDKAYQLLTQKVGELFKTLSLKCNTKEFFGDIIPTTPLSYLQLGQIWADEALSALWNEIGKSVVLLPDLITPEEKRAWLLNPDNAHQLARILELDLSKKNLKIFPEEIKLFTALRVLKLNYNQLTAFPVSNLPQLQELHLYDNQLTAFPVSNLPQLQVLDLGYNQLTAPPVLSNLPQLQELRLGNNQLTAPPVLNNLPQLQVLELDDNQLTAPPVLNNLPQLRTLCLDKNQLITPPVLNNLPQLQSLYLQINKLTAPPILDNLPQLKTFFINHNQLTAPPVLNNLPQLKMLILRHNQLTVPPILNNLPQLQELSLSYNQLTAPPVLDNLPQLRSISIGHNQLTTPPVLNNLPLLEKIFLDGNQLTTPPVLNNLPLLEEVFIRDNQLTASPVLNNLPRLKKVYLDNNQLTAPLLEEIFLGNKQLTGPLFFNNLPQLQKLSLNDNMILFVSDKDKNDLDKDYYLSSLKQFRDYKCKSNLANFFQLVPFCELKDEQLIKQLFYFLKNNDQYLVFEMVSQVAGMTPPDPFWGQRHTFDNMHVFRQAMRKAVSTKFDRLSPGDKNRVYEKICELAGRPKTEDKKWGKDHAFDHVLRLIDAMASI